MNDVRQISKYLNEVKYNHGFKSLIILGDKYDSTEPCPKDECIIAKNYASIIRSRQDQISHLCRSSDGYFVCKSGDGFRVVKFALTKYDKNLFLSSYIRVQVKLGK